MLLDILEESLPEWMFQPARKHWSTLMATIAVTWDCLVEGVWEARLAAMPGQVDTDIAPQLGGFLSTDALGLIGRDRRKIHGLSESVPAYALRLRRWLQDAPGMGTPWGLLLELQGVLGPDAGTLRIVSGSPSSGEWWTISGSAITYQDSTGIGWTYDPTAGTLVTATAPAHVWDWDSTSIPAPPDQGATRFWVVFYIPCNAPWAQATDGAFWDLGKMGDQWNDPNTIAPSLPTAGVIGLATPIEWVDLVRNVIAEWKAAGLPCAYAIGSLDSSAFNPTSDSTPTSVPDGTWGNEGLYNPSTHVRALTRFQSARYIAAPPGGARP